ncbi:hypothetical protein BRADI_4g27799v3 [Brachypodium distachyon]|uniref:Uncharacterized protein n=1 Tax=Brachypodium distachyon TaxID=15368 RepID=A0A2K2CQP1_BRADI|nr:hypothetical protein BRADI_4g27799v3 [Brachypodium distachyon]
MSTQVRTCDFRSVLSKPTIPLMWLFFFADTPMWLFPSPSLQALANPSQTVLSLCLFFLHSGKNHFTHILPFPWPLMF